MVRGSSFALVVAVLVGCEAPPTPTIATSSRHSGLILRGAEQATPDDHLTELLVHDDHVYVANSNYGLSVMRLDPEGSLTLTRSNTADIDPLLRCTSLAIHRSSASLYCASDWAWADGDDEKPPTLAVFDLSVPGDPVLRQRFELISGVTRDLEVVGDRLLLHHFDEGLWTAAIAADGTLDQLASLPVEGNARVSVSLAGGSRIATLFADVGTAEQPGQGGAELRLFTAEFVELDRLSLAGPALSLTGDSSGATRVVAALGSGGLALIDVEDDRLVLTRTFTPPAVVTHGLIDADQLIAITFSGAFGWTLGEDPADARMFGFGPAGQAGFDRVGNMLHGVMHEGELITSDWIHVERWTVDPLGDVVELDVPRGLYIGPSGAIRWQARNVGPDPLRVEFRVYGHDDVVAQALLEPGASGSFEIPDADRPTLLGDEPLVRMFAHVYDPELEGAGDPISSTMVVILVRTADQDPALGRPAPGDPFPALALQSGADTWFAMPTATGGGQTVWYWTDCAMMWPQLEDMAWLSRIGQLPREGPAIFIGDSDVVHDGFAARWGLWGAQFGYYGPQVSAEVSEHNAAFDPDVYPSFFIPRLPGDAMPTDYSIGADGIVRSVERMYRGPWTLRVPWQAD